MITFEHNLKVGDKVKIFYQKDNFNNKLYHVQGFVDDIVVVKWWRKSKRYWEYECLTPSWFYAFSKEDCFKIIRVK